MTKRRIIMAIGHKDMGANLPEQEVATVETAKIIADFIQEEWQIAIVHGSTPQVGTVYTAMNELGRQHDNYSQASASVCSAISQGYIGYNLQNGVQAEFIKRGVYKPTSTILIQVTMDPYDGALYIPVGAIGRMMTEEEANIEEAKGNHVTEMGGGYRRTITPPHPVAIVGIDTIKALIDVGQIVIAYGDEGIPVVEQGYSLRGTSAIIEEDLATGLLAKEIDADMMMILTSVDNMTLNYGTPQKQPIGHMAIDQVRDYIDQDQLEFTSMLSKVSASIDFLEGREGRKAIITTLDKAKDSLRGHTGMTAE